ncbi:MAG: hypothetical protein V8Q76_01250 [Bacteroides intestinalis]
MELKIYNQSEELKLTVSTSSSSTWNMELMTENAISVSFTHPFYVPLDVNDYVLLSGVKFSINKEYKPKQKSTQEYTYSVKFYGPEHDAQRVMYLNLTDGQYDVQFSLDGSPREHLKKWVDNMNRIYGREVWSMGDVVVAVNQTIEYNNSSCWDALASIAEAFETEWWADGFTINLSRCERGERISLGYMQGLTSLTQSENSNDVKFFTRLIPLGSTKNIDRSRYGYSRLQLPDKSTYVDRNTQYGLYEYVEEAAFAEIFPHYTGTVSSVRSEEKTGEDKKPFTIYYFKDNGMTFDPSSKDNEIAGLVKHVSFQTGDLAGRDFEANYNSATKEWEIINIYPDEETQIPGGNLIPRVGNTYIPWNFRMPAEYETQAEQDYKAAVDNYLKTYSEDVSKYGGDTDYIYIDTHNVPLQLGQSVRLTSDEYFGEVGYRDSRMTKVVRKLDNLSIATIECSNQVGKGWKSQVDSSITQLKYVLEQKEETTLDILKSWDGRTATDYRVMSALRVLKEITQRALSKIGPDQTEYLIKYLGGLEIGEAIDSLTAGKGIIADIIGRMQLSRLEVRNSLVVLRLIINEIQAMSGDFTFSDCGTIEKVELLDDGTYRLTLEKRTDTDWTSLDENDVMLSIINTLLAGGTDYYTSWFRCVTKNRNDNTLTVVLYPDSEVPGGKNYPPVEGYNVTRRGNAKVPDTGEAPNERAQSWLLSSREGRIMFLQNVFKPILEDYNYALTLGRFPNVKMIEKLPIGSTDVGVMSKIGVFEKIYEADWNGTIIPKKVDRGEWSLATAQGDEPYRFVDYETQLENQKVITTLEQHTVYHYGCKWGCLIDKTTEEPQWNSAGWVLLEGDKNYHLEFTSTAGWQFFKNGVNTDIAAVVSYGNRDITNVLMATTGVEVEWLRDTGNIPADNSWKPVYVDGQKHVIRLTSVDMGSEWGLSVRTVKFICRVFIPVGEDMETIENYVGFRI